MNTKSLSPNIIHKIKQLEIFTRRLLNGALVGDSRSAIKGSGFEFDQIREYAFGDDIRFIDWKASARNNTLLVKQYIEERSRTIILAVDISQSHIFGSGLHNKKDRIAQLACVLALVAQHGKDRVALLLFADEIVEYVPPGSSLHHIHTIMERLLTIEPQRVGTDISKALKYVLSVHKNDAILFMLSDFIDDNFDTYLGQAARKYDLVAVRCLDVNEKALPQVGFITVEDLESGELVELDVRRARSAGIKAFLNNRLEDQNRLFKKKGVDIIDVSPDRSDYITTMVRFFRRRMMY